MKVAIIGAGNVGKALGTSLSRAGHDVTISASTPQSARDAASAIGASAAASNVAAVDGAEIVILAVPYSAGAAVIADIAGHTGGSVIIDTTNPLKADYSGLATSDRSAAEEFQAQLPGSPVIKAFNTVFASNQADPRSAGEPIDGFVAGDDAKAKQTVISLVESMGLRPLDVGPLSSARYLEGMAYLNIGLNAANGWSWTSSWRLTR
jgi:NADPH-dependent F420 reductase